MHTYIRVHTSGSVCRYVKHCGTQFLKSKLIVYADTQFLLMHKKITSLRSECLKSIAESFVSG